MSFENLLEDAEPEDAAAAAEIMARAILNDPDGVSAESVGYARTIAAMSRGALAAAIFGAPGSAAAT